MGKHFSIKIIKIFLESNHQMESSNIKWECEWRTHQGMVFFIGSRFKKNVLAKIYIYSATSKIFIYIGIKYVDIGLNMS